MASSSARILVVGDNNTGKSTVIRQLLSKGSAISNGSNNNGDLATTSGFTLSVSLHSNRSGSRKTWLEIVDIQARDRDRPQRRHAVYRAAPINGLVLVYDVTNTRTASNLRGWVEELQSALRISFSGTGSSALYPPRPTNGSGDGFELSIADDSAAGRLPFPVLIVGSKTDIGSPAASSHIITAMSEDLGARCISTSMYADSLDKAASMSLESFLDDVAEHTRSGSASVSTSAWNKHQTPTTSSLHLSIDKERIDPLNVSTGGLPAMATGSRPKGRAPGVQIHLPGSDGFGNTSSMPRIRSTGSYSSTPIPH
ncbi:hypothetical protein GQ42DRAFT_6483 [Ramicandelaber brevisporus]|nr:hypothetical protein GQ42DRAFT_6483 [Ramicandelaber brevisporus]